MKSSSSASKNDRNEASNPAEEISFQPEEQHSYDAASRILSERRNFFGSLPSIVSMKDVFDNDTSDNSALAAASQDMFGTDSVTRTSTTVASAAEAARHNNAAPSAARAGPAHRHRDSFEIMEYRNTQRYPSLSPEFITLATPTQGHHELENALEKLEGLEKEESTLVLNTPLIRHLTELVTGEVYLSSTDALHRLEMLGRTVPRRVCQHPFRKNDIVWVCRTCQADETCVLCHNCFSQSNHEGHDVAFYHAQAGGCCDCGDPDAWDPAGFCPHHGPNATPASSDGLCQALDPSLVQRVRGVIPSCIDWMVREVAANSELAYARANPPKNKRLHKMKSQSASSVAARMPDSASDRRSLTESPARQRFSRRAISMPEEMMELDSDNDDAETNDDSDDLSVDNFPANNHFLHENPFAAMAEHGIELDYVFSTPTAALIRRHHTDSTSDRKPPSLQQQKEDNERNLELGITGSTGRGLYIVLHADEIHSIPVLQSSLRYFLGDSSYYTDALLSKLVAALRQYGQLVIWGTMELLTEIGLKKIQDQETAATTNVGAIISERASRLSRYGLFCSISTREELILEQRAVAVLQWLSCLARSCDPLCQTVAETILPNRHLVPLLRANFKMSARVTKTWYSLLLTLLAVPAFKSHLAAAYCDTYRTVTAKYARGMGVYDRSGYTLSVQFLNRVTYVIDLVQKRDLLGKLGKSLLETLLVACRNDSLNGRLNPNHFVLTHRRYSPCVSDLKCVLNVKGMPRAIACKGGTFLGDWISSLSVAQFMDSQVWRHWNQVHVEDDTRGWVGAFNASISLGSLFERLLGWEDEEESPIDDPSSPLSRDLMSCVELTYFILTNGVDRWQRSEAVAYESSPYDKSVLQPHKRCPASLPFSTISSSHGTALAMRHLPVSQVTPFSFHLPLHRFVAGCIRELCLRKNSDDGGIGDLLQRLRTNIEEHRQDDLFRGLMEFSVLVLSRAAQVRAGIWKRNGHGLNDQVLNYAEPPFCRNMRDADLLLTQFSAIGRTRHQSLTNHPGDTGMAFLSNLLLHRLGIFDAVGMVKAPDKNSSQYLQEIADRLYPSERKDTDGGDADMPWSYTPVRDVATSIFLVEEFLHFVIVFIAELPQVVPNTREEQTQQAQFRLFREVTHRLASGAKTHSELSEVHHVLSHWDNVLLSEEGKLLNPDDATGAALGTVLSNIADRKVSRGKMEPDKWEMRKEAWEYYDPSFFHISLRCHQTAAENRPKPDPDTMSPFGWKSKPYAPEPSLAHSFFRRLRRDATSDVSILAVTYKVLFMHLCQRKGANSAEKLGTSPSFRQVEISSENREQSETALARSIHIITLGAYAWQDAKKDSLNWRQDGGGSPGSLFFNRSSSDGAPTAGCWISEFLLANPSALYDCESYQGAENALLLLQRLAVHGGISGGFIAQDAAVRAGAAWLCEFALQHCQEAKNVVTTIQAVAAETFAITTEESEIVRRRKKAKEDAIAKVKADAMKFASMMEVDLGDSEDEVSSDAPGLPPDHSSPSRKSSFGSIQSSTGSAVARGAGSESPPTESSLAEKSEEVGAVPPRLLQGRPRCIICNYEDSTEGRVSERSDDDGEGQRKKSKRRAENALGFVGYAQASTVMKGGGGPAPDLDSSLSPVREFVGIHVALCGHAVHSECCESYLATVSRKEERPIGKRDEFRCPLCQRLSNCLIPFIDVGVDWIDSSFCRPTMDTIDAMNTKAGVAMDFDVQEFSPPISKLHSYLESTPWWVTRHNDNVEWDGQSAFVEKSKSNHEHDDSSARKPSRRIRSLKKKDLYAAWNAMMRTPRLSIVRRSLRRSSSRSSLPRKEVSFVVSTSGEESSGETIVWKRFMDLISDMSYRADSKRLGDDHLHDLFGEFRHYIVEKYAYNTTHKASGSDPTDWPTCLFNEPIQETKRQEMSREKLLSKLFLSIQAFTYSCCSEGFEARRAYERAVSVMSRAAKGPQDSTVETVFSRFGIGNVICNGKMIAMPLPSAEEDSGNWPFDGRLGKLRYLGLTVMAAAGAVAADLVQLALPFPLPPRNAKTDATGHDSPMRAPIAYPVLLGHVLTHVVAAMCATCGRNRARNDSLEVIWPVPFSARGGFACSDERDTRVDGVIEDCEGFLQLGLLARVLQTLLGSLRVIPNGTENPQEFASILQDLAVSSECLPPAELAWMKSCIKLLQVAVSNQTVTFEAKAAPTIELLREACTSASNAASTYLADAGAILQVLVPSAISRFFGKTDRHESDRESEEVSIHQLYEKLHVFLNLESMDEMLESTLVQQIVSSWYSAACRHACASQGMDVRNDRIAALHDRLCRTQGFRVHDWPSAGSFDNHFYKANRFHEGKQENDKACASELQPHDDASVSSMQIESLPNLSSQASITDILRTDASPTLLTFSSKKCVPLLGGCSPDASPSKANIRPRVLVMPTSYTDLYAELCSLMPDCEQTAVCLVCGEVLNACGKGECTRHSYKCGAGAGMFFLLQECSGLIMHKSKAAYIHSPYVDSHGETPQYRGRPLNLDLDRYEHLREVWFSHGVRQKVVAERGSSRQVIQPDFY